MGMKGPKCPVLLPWGGSGAGSGPQIRVEEAWQPQEGIRQLPREECSAGETRGEEIKGAGVTGTRLSRGLRLYMWLKFLWFIKICFTLS